MLPSLPQDKANHVVYGMVVFIAALFALVWFRVPYAAYAALAITAGVGLLKEAVDAWENHKATGDWRTGPHGVEGMDAVATAGGGFGPFVALWIGGMMK